MAERADKPEVEAGETGPSPSAAETMAAVGMRRARASGKPGITVTLCELASPPPFLLQLLFPT
jgi:hypothetical protein